MTYFFHYYHILFSSIFFRQSPIALNSQDICSFVSGTVFVNRHFCSVLEYKTSLWKEESKPSKTAAKTTHEILYFELFHP